MEDNNKKVNEDNKYKNGDVFAYKIVGDENKKNGLEGKYLIFRKVDDYKDNNIYESMIVYVQITKNSVLPKTENELNELDYIIMGNMGNVRHEYRMRLDNIPKKKKKDIFIYLGNFPNLRVPADEYINEYFWSCSLKKIKYIIDDVNRLGTERKPVYYEVDPKNIEDSYIRFLMRVKYYKDVLKIDVPDNAIVKDNALLYVSLIDSFMIDGFLKNPQGFITEEIKKEAYKRIEELRKIINATKDKDKLERIEILNNLEEKIKKYEPIVYKIYDRYLVKNKNK